jgi:arylamine N-acetyltransferase
MDDTAEAITNLGTQEIRLVHDNIDKQNWRGSKLWIYQYRNDASAEWNSFYSFSEVEFFQEDFEVLNWWSSAKTFHRWTPLAVRFLREGEPVELDQDDAWTAEDTQELKSVAKVVLVGDVVKLSTGGRTRVVHRCESEEERRQALGKYIGIHLTEEEFRSIHGYGTALPGGNER